MADRQETLLRMGGLLGLSLILGLAFNAANPLGVRSTTHTALPAKSAATRPSGPPSYYANETLELKLEPVGATAHAPAAGVAPQVATAPAGMGPALTWAETKPLVASKQVVLVDARAAVYYQTEHIPGAISLPTGSSAAELAAFAAKYPRNTPLVLYCGSTTCPLSRQLAGVLASQYGFTNVREMPGGYVEYRQQEPAPGKEAAR